MSSRVIGLVGLGAIGKAAVRMLKAFGCKILYYDVFRASEDYEKKMILLSVHTRKYLLSVT